MSCRMDSIWPVQIIHKLHEVCSVIIIINRLVSLTPAHLQKICVFSISVPLLEEWIDCICNRHFSSGIESFSLWDDKVVLFKMNILVL